MAAPEKGRARLEESAQRQWGASVCRHAAPVLLRRAMALSLDGAGNSKSRQVGRARTKPDHFHAFSHTAIGTGDAG